MTEVFTRRSVLQVAAATSLWLRPWPAFAQYAEEVELLAPMDSPSVTELTRRHPFGSHPASRDEIARAENIVANTPTGPRPIDVAASFIERFYVSDPHAISEWPKAESWNPLIAGFFDATNYQTTKDTVAWCAAFVNWCLERSRRPATKSSSSQSFAITTLFKITDNPAEGDIAILTCYKKGTNISYGIGHVTFFKRAAGNNSFIGLGGNQRGERPSIISEMEFPDAFPSSRLIGSTRVPVDYRINRFLHVV